MLACASITGDSPPVNVGRSQGKIFEVDLDSKTARDASLDKDLSKKYQIPPKVK